MSRTTLSVYCYNELSAVVCLHLHSWRPSSNWATNCIPAASFEIAIKHEVLSVIRGHVPGP